MTGQRQRLQNYIEALLASPADPTAPEEPDGLLPTRADLADLLTDLGNARRFATQHGQDVRYCSGMGWLVWDGKRWARDDGGGVMRRAKATALGLYDEAARALDVAIAAIQQLKTQGDTLGPEGLEEAQARLKAQYQRARKLMAWALQSQSRARLEAMVALAQSEPDLVVHVADLDADPWLFNCANGTLDLRAGELREHRREDYLTMLAGAAYDPAAFGGKWAAHLETFLPDPDVRRQVQRTFGRALAGGAR